MASIKSPEPIRGSGKPTRLRITISYNARIKRWAATVKGQSRQEYLTQRGAIAGAVDLCVARRKEGLLSELIIKRPDGRIRDNRTYGADPRKTRG